MNKTSTWLLFGPYSLPPGYSIGDEIHCRSRGRKVEIRSITDAPVPWFNARRNGHYVLILCGDLVRAVKREAVVAIAHNWGITDNTVSSWRRKLGVGKMTPGTKAVWRALMPVRITPAAKERARKKMRTKTTRAKIGDSKTGKLMHDSTRAALLKAVSKPKSEAHREAISRAHRKRGTLPPGADRNWTPAEDRKLGTAPDRQIGEAIGRTTQAVKHRRLKLGIDRFRR